MGNGISAIASFHSYQNGSGHQTKFEVGQLPGKARTRDTVHFGADPPSHAKSHSIMLEKAYAQLQNIVGEARVELGIESGAIIDTSPEATATRITDFALNFFDQFRQNHEELSDTEAREEFVELIGGAILQGISEAEEILGALSALNETITNDITTIKSIIQQRLDAFLGQGETE